MDNENVLKNKTEKDDQKFFRHFMKRQKLTVLGKLKKKSKRWRSRYIKWHVKSRTVRHSERTMIIST